MANTILIEEKKPSPNNNEFRSKISRSNTSWARSPIPLPIMNFLCADIGDVIHWSKIEDVLCREIVRIEVVKPDGSISKQFTLKPLEIKEEQKFDF